MSGFDAEPPPGYWRNSKGDLIREANISAADRDMDRVTRKIHMFGQSLSAQMFRFREHTLADVMGLVERVVERYGGRMGGRKGNVALSTFDGRLRVLLQQSERVAAGPEIAAAQTLIGECVEEWSARGNRKLRALVDGAFKPDATGRLSVAQLVRLRRVEIDDERWRRAQAAISDALRPVGRAEYLRLYRRETPADPWEAVPLHLATVRAPAEAAGADAAENLVARVKSAVEEARHCGLGEGAIMEALREAKRRKPEGARVSGG